MSILEFDHASDGNPLKELQDALRRMDELERATPTGFFNWGDTGSGSSGTTMNTPGNVTVPTSSDYSIGNHPLALARVISMYKALPGLVGFWPMSAVRRDSATEQARDVSGAGYHLTNNNAAQFGYADYAPYCAFNGTTQYLSRADGGAGNWADIIGTETSVAAAARGLTMGCWFNFDAVPAADKYLMAKLSGGAGNFSYFLRGNNDGRIRGGVSVDGTNIVARSYAATNITASTWIFSVMRFDPSTSVTVWYNSNNEGNRTSVPAAIFDGSADFTIGARHAGNSPMAGKIALGFLCMAQLDSFTIFALYQLSRALFGV